MRKLNANIFMILAMVATAAVAGSCVSAPAEGPTVTLRLAEEKQTIDGFGISQADYADDVFIFPDRALVLDQLFGEQGLKLNILRGEIFPHYESEPGQFDIAADEDISDDILGKLDELAVNDLLRRGQFWLTTTVARKYPQVLHMFTAWSPPAWMKEGGHSTEIYPASGGKLMHEHYQSYADYMTRFYKAFQAHGVDIYALSPSNEPGYAAPWNSCLWTPEEMGESIHDYLLPTFRANDVKAKAIFGENPSWSVTSKHFENISTELFIDRLLTAYPDLKPEEAIAGGHAYELPKTLPLPLDQLQNPIVAFPKTIETGIHTWITEMSNIDELTLSMEDALHWGASWSDYLSTAHVSAILWWLGAAPKSTNESLIALNQEEGTFVEAKRFDVMGNYSSYIPKGSICIDATSAELPEGVKVSTFKNGNQHITVVVNPGEAFALNLQLDGAKAKSHLQAYTTTADLRWEPTTVKKQHGIYRLQVPAQSVVTYTGNFR